jgi:competence protein ComEC
MGLGLVNRFLAAERERWPLWLPVMLGTASGIYFALPFEPQPVFAWGALAMGLALAALAMRGWARWPLALAAGLLLGFSTASSARCGWPRPS